MDVISLKKRKDFLLIRNSSLKAGSPAFLIQAKEKTSTPSDDAPTPQVRFGLVVTKKIGNSVTRNRLKRRLRALTREALKDTTTEKSFDFVYVARPGLAQFDFQDMVSFVRHFLLSHHLLTQKK